MGMHDYEQATAIISKHASKAQFIGARAEDLIRAAEQVLGVKFPPTYRRFLRDYGAGSFGAVEIYGITNGDLDTGGIPDAVWYTLLQRKNGEIPADLVVIYSVGQGEEFYLDFSSTTGNEVPVVAFWPGRDLNQPHERIARDFGEFLLERVKWVLEVESS